MQIIIEKVAFNINVFLKNEKKSYIWKYTFIYAYNTA